MFVFGKIIGALVGIGVYYPFGLFLGLALGHLVDLYQQKKYMARLAGGPREQIFQDNDSYIPLIFTLYGRMTALTGGPNQAQVAYVERLLEQNFGFFFFDRESAVRAFNLALENTSLHPVEAARELSQSFFLDQYTLMTVFRTCLEIATLSVPLRPGVQEALAQIAGIFGFEFRSSSKPQDYRVNRSGPDDYQVLGLRMDTPDEEVKKRYRTLVRQYHPDSLAHLPDSDPKKKQAEDQFIKIREAYDRIKAQRGL